MKTTFFYAVLIYKQKKIIYNEFSIGYLHLEDIILCEEIGGEYMQSKDRTYQVIAIVALVIGVCALTVGFAAFTTNLTISSHAEVSPGSSVLDVVFSTSNSSAVTGSVVGTASGTSGASGATATLTNTTVTGIQANFTEPGQKVTYDFYVYNNSAFTRTYPLPVLFSMTDTTLTGS